MLVVLREQTECHGGHRVVAPAVVESGEETPALL